MKECFACRNLRMRLNGDSITPVCKAMGDEDQKQFSVYDVIGCANFQPVSGAEKVKKEGNEMSFLDIVLRIFDEEKALFKKKNDQYGINDPIANFRDGAYYLGLDPEVLDNCFQSLKGYCNKHISFVQRSKKLTPAVYESLRDIAIYAIIAMAMYKMSQGDNEE